MRQCLQKPLNARLSTSSKGDRASLRGPTICPMLPGSWTAASGNWGRNDKQWTCHKVMHWLQLALLPSLYGPAEIQDASGCEGELRGPSLFPTSHLALKVCSVPKWRWHYSTNLTWTAQEGFLVVHWSIWRWESSLFPLGQFCQVWIALPLIGAYPHQQMYTPMRDVNSGETVHTWRRRVYGYSLYFPLNFDVKLELLVKKLS